MAYNLPVSSFPDPWHTRHRYTPEPKWESLSADADSTTLPRAKRAKHYAVLESSFVFADPDLHARTAKHGGSAHDIPDSELPYSPIVFRSFMDQQHERLSIANQSGTPDRNVTLPSKHHPSPDAITGRYPLSTKDSIAGLGLSRRRPSPDYSFLVDSRRSSENTLPPRSTSLRVPHLHADMPSASSSRSPSPSHMPSKVVGNTDELAFAKRQADEADTGSHKITRVLSSLSPSVSPSLPLSSQAKSDIAHDDGALTLESKQSATPPRSESSALVVKSKKTGIPSNLPDLTPYPLLPSGVFGLQPPPVLPPFSLKSKSKSKSNLKESVSTSPTEKQSPTSSLQSDKSFSLSFKRALLRSRRATSVSSADFLSSFSSEDKMKLSSGDADPTASSTTLVATSSGRASPAFADTGGVADKNRSVASLEAMKRGNGSSATTVRTQRIVGDKWEEQDLSEIIPTLREMKFTGA